MEKIYTALGLMSGTSLDGVDVSIIESNGINEYHVILDDYFEYNSNIIKDVIKVRENISTVEDLKAYQKEINALEKDITLFQAEIVDKTLKKVKKNVDIIGFHGQTIFHNPEKKFTKQLGDGRLLSQLSKKEVVYDFRKNDLINGGQGAPLTPIFHNVLANKIHKTYNLEFPINILNIGGISNVTTTVNENDLDHVSKIYAYDIGPGNCLIDDWIRKNSGKNFDQDGLIARSGKTDDLILNQALENFASKFDYNKSLDIKDFDIFFAKGLSLENGAATITNFTAELIAEGIRHVENKIKTNKSNWLVCGGGRKNKYLLESIEKNFKELVLKPIENYKVNGDFVESQAFAFLAIRSLKNMPISFPNTTRCKKPLTGGILVKNF
jgi:anhydro-N-acetylmuramic acid kinase